MNRGTSNERGWFRVDPGGKGEFDVLIVADGYAPLLMRAPTGKHVGKLVLEQSKIVNGSIRCNGQPLTSATILVVADDGAEVPLKTDADGKFSVVDPSGWAREIRVHTGRKLVAIIDQADFKGLEAVELTSCEE